ncbi:ammonium transporter [Limnoglobus roseus]|uniref:ammonium transporter n=1 Tax=Limnoglobus roseus TaxID=2598579 RepID=UPI001FE8D420|nr:ammonium transporter [Limnoglobus roseus]
MFLAVRATLLATLFLFTTAIGFAQAPPPAPPTPPPPAWKADVDAAASGLEAKINSGALAGTHKQADIAWMLVSCALVMLMMPGLALFYGGMARRKNILGTMMHTMVALGLVGVQWVVIGYALAFGAPAIKFSISSDDKGEPIKAGVVGFSKELMFLGTDAALGTKSTQVEKTSADVLKEKGIDPEKATDEQKKEADAAIAEINKFTTFPNTNLPLYLHAMFQGMFAIITVALVSGAFAERVKFGAYLLFAVLWTTIVYDPLAHMVWSFEWSPSTKVDIAGTGASPGASQVFPAAGLLGANGAIDFAGGTVVHIAAGFSGLAAILLLRKRIGYGKHPMHPSSMIFTLLGAGMLWFGWFGFNGGSALFSNGQAISAFTFTQIAAAAGGMSWLIVEWLHRGKPTALGFASGLVAGLVAITPASGFVYPAGALAIGLIAGVVCYWAVAAKGMLGYDDSLDAFGVHGVGGFLGAILTAFFVSLPLWSYGAEMPFGAFPGKTIVEGTNVSYDKSSQIMWQIKAACLSAVYAFVVTSILVLIIDKTIGFTVSEKDEAMGLDLSQHGETGLDLEPDMDGSTNVQPKSAAMPPANGGGKRFGVTVGGASAPQLMAVWSKLCQTGEHPPSKEFRAVYPYVTTVSGTTFRFRGGDPVVMKAALQKLFAETLGGSVTTTVEA